MSNKQQIQIYERLTALETQVDTILTNHLPHIQAAIKDLSARFWAIVVLLIANLVAVIVNLIK